ncbi:MAG: GNAT family N-acetyltransferase [Alphaproteobacteria bacterium]
MTDSASERHIAAIRRFNRFYTQKIGVLEEDYLQTPFSLAEARVLYELAHREATTAAALARDLAIDPGYLSRILRSFGARGFVRRARSTADRRQSDLVLTDAGHKAFAPLNAASRAGIGRLIEPLAPADQRRLVVAMEDIMTMLGAAPETRAPYLIRAHQPGDMGWVIGRHGRLYAEEYGWDETFEGMVAEIAGAFIQKHDPKFERCWIAEMDGETVGSVFLVRQSRTVGKLRLLIVDPKARGLGVGRRLVQECIRFARRAGYRKVRLWTNNILLAARAIYVAEGFRLTDSAPHRSFGQDLVGETWELAL